MTSPPALRKDSAEAIHRDLPAPVMTFSKDGLALGNTILAPTRRDLDGTPQIASDGAEERILVLLTVAHGKTVRPGVLGNIRRAANYWRRGETHLAAIEIALSGLPALPDQEQACMRLHRGEEALAQGLTPRELIKACGLSPAALDVLKSGYNPSQPRVPKGNSDGGQWTSGETPSATPGENVDPQGRPEAARRVPVAGEQMWPPIREISASSSSDTHPYTDCRTMPLSS